MTRTRIVGLLLAGLVVVSSRTRLLAAEGADKLVKIVLGPSLSVPTEDSVHVWWNVNADVEDHYVEFGLTPSLGSKVTLEEKTQFPFLSLIGLERGKTYHYRVGTGEHKSEIFTFQLPDPEQSMRIVMWADNQHGYEVFKEKTVPLALKLRPNFLLVPGDVVEMGFLYRDWRRDLYEPAAPLLRTVPWYPVRGNHDNNFPLAQRMMPLPGNNHWYARTYGSLRIVVLDTNLDYNPNSPQVEWLANELQGDAWRDASFRIVSFHHPPFNLIQNRSNDDGDRLCREVLVPLLEEGGADFVICGHAHVYERGARKRPDGRSTTYLVVGGGGGTLDNVRAGHWPHIDVSVQRHHVVVADVVRDKITVRAIDSTNEKELDAFAVTGGPLAAKGKTQLRQNPESKGKDRSNATLHAAKSAAP
ncbi:MAG: metallophosphoesterase family protein [Planctomycetota bacterium]